MGLDDGLPFAIMNILGRYIKIHNYILPVCEISRVSKTTTMFLKRPQIQLERIVPRLTFPVGVDRYAIRTYFFTIPSESERDRIYKEITKEMEDARNEKH